MANADVVIRVKSEGAENISQVKSELDKLTDTSDKTSKSLTKQTDLTRGWNTSINQEIPAMQTLNPLLNTFNLGMLTSVGAVGLVGAGIGMMAQSTLALSGNVASAGTTMNSNTIGPMQNFYSILGSIGTIALATGVTMAQLTAGLTAMNPAITDQSTEWTILNQAAQIYKATGMSMATVVGLLSGALAGTQEVHDKLTGALLTGTAAEQQEYQNLLSMQNGTGQFSAAMKDLIGNLNIFTPLLDNSPQSWHIWDNAVKQLGIDAVNGFILVLNTAINLMGTLTDMKFPNIPGITPSAGAGTTITSQQQLQDILKNPSDTGLYPGVDTGGITPTNPDVGSGNGPGSINSIIDGLVKNSTGTNQGYIPGQASGGITTSPGLSWVGENGKELLNLPAGATVMPLSAAGAGGMGGANVTFNINGVGTSINELTEQITDKLMDLFKNRGGMG